MPPYYWGVNRVTGSFAGSIDIRPEVMVELMSDVFRSLAKAGVQEVYCITGHYDAAHGQAIIEAVRRANREGSIRAHFVVPSTLGRRLGLAASPASCWWIRRQTSLGPFPICTPATARPQPCCTPPRRPFAGRSFQP